MMMMSNDVRGGGGEEQQAGGDRGDGVRPLEERVQELVQLSEQPRHNVDQVHRLAVELDGLINALGMNTTMMMMETMMCMD